MQECFAVAGIAAGVALLFASQVAGSSMQSAVASLSHGIVGRAELQLLARGANGLPADTLRRVRAVPGVRTAAPLLEADAQATGPRGSASVLLVGADSSLSQLGGDLLRHTSLSPFGRIGAIVLPSSLSRAIGVTRFGQEASFQIAGRITTAPLYAQLGHRQIGQLADTPVVLAPLPFAQQMAGLRGRVSRILVQPSAHATGVVRAALRAIAGHRLDLEPVEYDEKLFAKAATASSKSTLLFAVVSALVGFLFAFNATLFAAPQRRRAIAELQHEGYARASVIALLMLDAIALGLFACALGLLLGEELSIHVLHSDPAFLSLAFAFGSERVVSWQSVAIAAGGGMLAALVAILLPLRDLLTGGATASSPAIRRSIGFASAPVGLALVGLLCLGAASAILLAAPEAAAPGMVLLVCALLLVLPAVLDAVLTLVKRVASSFVGIVAHLAAMELGANRARALAIAATGAIAVFGSVAVQGAHDDLLAGLERAARETGASSALWVTPAGEYDLLATAPFAPNRRAALERVAGVRAVLPYRSGLLDYGNRRVLVSAPAAQANPLLPAGQIVSGDRRRAEARLHAGGWLTLSPAIARERDLRIGQALTLPTPNPVTFRLAALTTNLGWAPGAIVMNASDYARAWASGDVGAYGVSLEPGAAPASVAHALEGALGRGSGLSVQSATRRSERQDAVSRRALARLAQIATLILAAAVLAMAAAIGALIWQRRPRLSKLRIDGVSRVALWCTILFESLLLLGVGCATGAAFGLYGKQLADRALASVIDFPVAYSLSVMTTLRSLALVVATALALLSVPAYLAASVPPSLALQD